MKYSLTILSFVLCLMILGISCSDKSIVLDTQPLKEYFLTDDVNVKSYKGIIELNISNSKLIKSEFEKKGIKWINSEPIASIGAIMVFNNLKDKSLDSIKLIINNNNKIERYSYGLENIKTVLTCVDVARAFCFEVGNLNFAKAKERLSTDILRNNDMPVDSIFSILFNQKKVTEVKILGFNVHDGMIGIYANPYNNNEIYQTYIFSFNYNKPSEIIGVSTP